MEIEWNLNEDQIRSTYHIRRGLGGPLRIVEDDGELVVAAAIRRRRAGVDVGFASLVASDVDGKILQIERIQGLEVHFRRLYSLLIRYLQISRLLPNC